MKIDERKKVSKEFKKYSEILFRNLSTNQKLLFGHLWYLKSSNPIYRFFNSFMMMLCRRRRPNFLSSFNACSTVSIYRPVHTQLLDLYHHKVKKKELQYDVHQMDVLTQLSSLQTQVERYNGPTIETWKHRWGIEDKPKIPKGLYLHGGVGCGKVRSIE